MKSQDIISLVNVLGPIIAKAVNQFQERIDVLEKHNEELRDATAKMGEHVKALQAIQVPTAQEIAKLVEVKEVDLDAMVKQVLENIPAAPTVEDIAKLVPVPKDGKDADPELIKTQVKDAMALWSGEFKLALPEIIRDSIGLAEGATVRDAIKQAATEAVAALPKPKDGVDGTSVDKEELHVIVAEHVEGAMKTLPVPKDGKDATQEDIAAAVEKVLATWERPKDGESVPPATIKAMIDEAVAAIPRVVQDGKDATPEQIAEAVEKVLATWPKPKDGVNVDKEEIQKIVAEELVSAIEELPAVEAIAPTEDQVKSVVEKVLATWPKPKDGDSVTVEQLAPMVAEQVNMKVAAIPAPKDGISVVDAMQNKDGNLVFVFSNGLTKDVGKVLGDRGEDGFKFTDVEFIESDADVIIQLKAGERVKNLTLRKPSVADFYKGIYKEGIEYKRGDLTTYGGSLWLALRDTKVRPDAKDVDDWKLIVKRGRDGKDFTPIGK
jgi:hypothetical protein